MFREEDTLLAGAKNGNAPTIVSSKLIVSFLLLSVAIDNSISIPNIVIEIEFSIHVSSMPLASKQASILVATTTTTNERKNEHCHQLNGMGWFSEEIS